MVAKRKNPEASARRPAYWDDPMSPKQEAIFRFVRRFYGEHGRGPSSADVIAGLSDISKDAVRYNLKALERIDYLLRLTEDGATRWSPTGKRALQEADLWRLVDQGLASWSGGKPKGLSPPIKLPPGLSVSDLIIQERERLRS